MQIFLKTLRGDTQVLELEDIEKECTLEALKNEVEIQTKVPYDLQRLCYNGRQLNDKNLIEHHSTITLCLSIRGGVKNPGRIKNKMKRAEVYVKYKSQKKAEKRKLRLEKVKEVEELGEKAPPKQIPRTLENTREYEETMVKPGDNNSNNSEFQEILGDEADDEFSKFFNNDIQPKIMITTRPKCSRKLFPFIGDLMQMIPQAFYYQRKSFTVTEMVKDANDKKFTHLVILSEKQKKCNGLLVTMLPSGPTAFFKLSSFEEGSTIQGHGKPTSHIPELIMNNFNTRLGRRTARVLGSLFPHQPQLEGRQVVTFHNQRDFIFIRHHRYIYRKEGGSNSNDKKNNKSKGKKNNDDDAADAPATDGVTRARLQELGPRFTLKLKYIQEGIFDGTNGEYEWIMKRADMETSRRKFEL
jgi:ribosome production factor 1